MPKPATSNSTAASKRKPRPIPKREESRSKQTKAEDIGYDTESVAEDADDGSGMVANQMLATLIRDIKKPRSSTPSTGFLNAKTLICVRARDKMEKMARQGADSLEGALADMKAAKAEEAGSQQRKNIFLSTCMKQGEHGLYELYHKMDQDLQPFRIQAMKAACDNVVDNPGERRALLKRCGKNTLYEIDVRLEDLRNLVDAESLAKHYKALLEAASG